MNCFPGISKMFEQAGIEYDFDLKRKYPCFKPKIKEMTDSLKHLIVNKDKKHIGIDVKGH